MTGAAKRRAWESLAWRLTLAFVLLSVLTLSMVGLYSYAYTRDQFDQLLTFQVRGEVENAVRAYWRQHHSLAGLRVSGPGGQGASPRPSERGPFVILDAEHRTVLPAPNAPAGSPATAAQIARAFPVRVQNRIVAYLAPTGERPPRDERSAQFLARTARGVSLAMLAAALVAVLVGV